jgi:hypothetical protein
VSARFQTACRFTVSNWGGPTFVGVMTQDVLRVMPDAVAIGSDGFYRVDYEMLGTRMMTLASGVSGIGWLPSGRKEIFDAAAPRSRRTGRSAAAHRLRQEPG